MYFIKNSKIVLKKTLCLLLACAIAVQLFAACSASSAKKDGKVTFTEAPFTAAGTEPAPTGPAATPATTPGSTPVPTQKPTETQPFADVVLARETKLNYFAIPQLILELMTPADIELYKRVVIAFMAGETSVQIPTELGEYPDLWRVVDMYFPVFFVNVNDKTITESDGTISWTYTDPESHSSRIDGFEDTVLSRLSSVREGDTDLVKILAVYKDFTSSITYSDEHEGGSYKYRHCKDAILYGKGVCWCFARAFNFMICQLGVVSTTVHGLRRGDNATHEWVVFLDGDTWRYCDPTWDIGGWSLNYFGFTIKTRNNDGFPQSHVTVLEGSKYLASDYFDVSDTFFRPLYTGLCSGEKYEIDHEANAIRFYEYGGSVLVFDLSTGEYYNG